MVSIEFFGQKSIQFCTPPLETPQSILPYLSSTPASTQISRGGRPALTVAGMGEQSLPSIWQHGLWSFQTGVQN